ncbi:MAG: hypothetical protein E6J90_08915 [Deltaproteobacteria bacterium]|nr:MAG: hypothetical protein E6J90_08915 [Deltaproteobacteria bacterium]
MKRMLVAAVLLALTAPSHADVIVSLGVNPNSGAGAFANTNPGTGGGGSGLFTDIYTFALVGGPQFLTIASVTNVFASADQFISGFTGAVLNDGPNGVPGGGDDFFAIGPVGATPCVLVPSCQGFAGAALLNSGNYYLRITGDSAVNAGYGGNLSVASVPGPLAGAGIPGLIVGLLGWLGLRRRRHAG